jgi:hypothetical protein
VTESTESTSTGVLDVLKGILTEHPTLAALVAELAPYAPALSRMVKEEVEDLIETIQRKDWYAADQAIAAKMTEAEMHALTEEGRNRIVELLAKTASDTALLKEIALRLAIALATAGVGAL